MQSTSKPSVIVVGVDYSPSSDLAFDRALELASAQADTEVHVINVVSALPAAAYGIGVPNAFTPDQAFATLAMYTQRRVEQFNARRPYVAPQVSVVCHLRHEAAAPAIAQLALDLDAELIVVGTHGRRGASRWLIGSVAEATVRLAPCPVLVVRPKTEPSLAERERSRSFVSD